MTDQAPLVSVVMPVRDGAPFVEAAVASVLSQSLEDFELLVIDDGSRDATASILARLANADGRIRVLVQGRLGIVAALNRGLAAARGNYIARLDADDRAWPERLARQAAYLDANPTIAVLGGACRVIGPDGAARRKVAPPLAPDAVHAGLSRHNCLIHPAVMMRRAPILALGGYREAFRAAEDYDLWLRVRERHRLANLPDTVIDYREHPGQGAWHDLERRILAEIGALAAAAWRDTGVADGAETLASIDRATLLRWGMDDASIASFMLARALGSARTALSAGHLRAARAATLLAARQPGSRLRTRAHIWALLGQVTARETSRRLGRVIATGER